CEDLGLKSEKTIQRLIKELDGKWFEIRRGNGQKQSTEYVPSKTSHQAAQELRKKEEAGKTDRNVARTRTKMSTNKRERKNKEKKSADTGFA
ncbi:MAG: hypothetical protein ACK5NN_07430, partial [Sphingomonadaceae bacterium]